MEWTEKLQRIIDLVEQHLQRREEPVEIEQVCEIAQCSYGFFQKVFSYMNNISFAEYVRSRKLTLAGYDLKSTNMKVVEVSYKYGYDSPTSFTKAFQQFHGMSPTQARKHEAKLHVYPKMQLHGLDKFTWQIMKKPSIRLVGKSIHLSCDEDFHKQGILKFWSDCQRDGSFSDIIRMDSGNPKGLFGLVRNYDKTSNCIEYAIMVESGQELADDYVETILGEETWAVFDCHGNIPNAILNGWKYLNEEWLVKYPFRHAASPEIEWYSDGNVYDEQYLSQIWIPIVEEE